MAKKKAKSTLTFAVTIPQCPGVSIKDTRQLLFDAIQASRNSFQEEKGATLPVKIYLLNKETSYA